MNWNNTVIQLKKLLKKGLIIFSFSAFLYLLLELGIRNFNIISVLSFTFKNISKMLLASLTLSVIVTIALAIINNIVLVFGGMTYTFILITISNFIKIQLRGEPIIPSDIDSLKASFDLLQMVSIKYVIILVVFTVVTLYAIVKLYKNNKTKFFNYNKIELTTRIALIIISVISLGTISNVHAQNNSFRKGMNLTGFRYYRGSTLLSFQKNSFVLGFVDNFSGPAMKELNNYSEEEIYSILDKYQENSEKRNSNKSRDSFEDISVIYVLSESLADPRVIEGTNLDESPIPYIQDPSDKYMAGKLIVPVYGGGTPNSEFELLTGLAIQNIRTNMSIAYQKILPYRDSFPSFVDDFKRHNPQSRTKAIHAYNSRLYKRRDVYGVLGFDEMYFDSDMRYTYSVDNDDRISDAALYEEALFHLKTDPNDQFLHLLSMQNHSSYTDKYNEYTFTPETGDEHLDEQLKYYLQGLHITDGETEKFLKEIDKLNRNIAVVFYGDHHPGLYGNIADPDDIFPLYTTDFFIYTNFTDENVPLVEPVSLTLLENHLYEAAGVKTNAIQQLVWELRQEISGSVRTQFLLKNNEVVEFDDLTDKQQELVTDYYLIQYDIIEGESFSQNYIREKGW